MRAQVAGAPVSFGVFELTPEGADVIGPDEMAEVLQSTGYTGIDLGPVGYLGRDAALRDRLTRHGLELAGGWIDLPFSDDAAFEAALGRLDDALDVQSAVVPPQAGTTPALPPRPTLADSGDDRRRAHPGGGAGLELDTRGWDALERNVAHAVSVVRARGLEPTFHHHACTYVETPPEIDEFLARTDVGLTFDTGHLLLGGGDPLTAWNRWRSRIDHLHLKDVRVDRMREVTSAGGGMVEVWSGGVFVPLGEGDLDIVALMDAVASSDYAGWVVVEQDVMPGPGHDRASFTRDHTVNREVLRRWL
ncbi:TIM barrel protein [Herbiconiux sp. SALV-R1]|nr:TIM barrel protein [Herbiconiux sp. SALV-R1]